LVRARERARRARAARDRDPRAQLEGGRYLREREAHPLWRAVEEEQPARRERRRGRVGERAKRRREPLALYSRIERRDAAFRHVARQPDDARTRRTRAPRAVRARLERLVVLEARHLPRPRRGASGHSASGAPAATALKHAAASRRSAARSRSK